MVQPFCHENDMFDVQHFARCSYEEGSNVKAKHMYQVVRNRRACIPKECSCEKQMPLNSQQLGDLGAHPFDMAFEIAKMVCIFEELETLKCMMFQKFAEKREVLGKIFSFEISKIWIPIIPMFL